jgi:hypothetical protein
MNIALGALIITVLLLPGSAILKAYYTSLRAKDRDIHIPFAEILFRGLIYSFITHISAICIIGLFGYRVDFRFLYKLIIGDKITIDNIRFTNYILQFGTYNLVLFAFLFATTKLQSIL